MERRELDDKVMAFKTARPMYRCAKPGCDKIGQWTICGPAVVVQSPLPDVCDEHLDFGRAIGAGETSP